MERCVDWYAPPGAFTVVDLGSADVNGSYRTLFDARARYIGVDRDPGTNVDVVLSDPYVLPFTDASVEVIISGQMLEHCSHFWRIFSEVARILTPEGCAFMIAPSAGPIHRFPVDCYRFFPDAWEALAQSCELRLVHCWLDDRGPWRDLVGVFQKGGRLQRIEQPRIRRLMSATFAPHPDPEVEAEAGARHYLEVLAQLHAICKPSLYLEIGVRKGNSLQLGNSRTIGIDPNAEADPLPSNATLYKCTSDDFFFFHADTAIDAPIDLAFIDGMHLCEHIFRDFMNLERLMSRHGLIVIDDVFPNHSLQAHRNRRSQHWTGDIWKFVELLRETRPDLQLTFLNARPSGLLLIQNPDPTNSQLNDGYNPLVAQLLRRPDEPLPEWVVNRTGALDPMDDVLAALASQLV